MKKFLQKVSLLLLLTLIAMLPFHFLYTEIIVPNRMMVKGTDKFRAVPDNIQVANLGNSHGARSFEYTVLDTITGFNFGLSSQTFPDDWAVLNYYQDHLSDDAVLFINFSYMSLYRDERREDQNESRIRLYDDFLPTEFQPNPAKDSRWAQMFPVIRLNPSDVRYLTRSPKGYLKSWESASMAEWPPERIAESSRKTVEKHCAMIQDHQEPRAMEALDKIMSLCRSKGWTPIFYSAPYPAQYVEAYPEAILERFYADMKELSEQYGAVYLDYSRNPEFAEDYSLFMNADHLNKKGAEKFTRMILRDARTLYPESPLRLENSLQ
jgi:hypothetical protein